MIHFIISIIVGAIIGWLAGIIMKSKNGILINIILGLAGGFVGKLIFGTLTGGLLSWVGDILFSVIGACILIAVVRFIKKK
ncbi:MAG: GlsB/YeaQ/YmgE family stress response membrane protein [Lachnospiraceae bacterium]|nr:GlsB/YeaQ/YmgE family stress response membrane protein [Lachnospiraceae bacterium]